MLTKKKKSTKYLYLVFIRIHDIPNVLVTLYIEEEKNSWDNEYKINDHFSLKEQVATPNAIN